MFLIRKLKIAHQVIRRNLESSIVFGDIKQATGTHGFFLEYLFVNRDKKIFQKDIEHQFNLRRSTVTEILNNMEKNGFITRVQVKEDGRLKQIVLTEKGNETQDRIKLQLKEIDDKVRSALTEEEQNQLSIMLDKITNKLLESEASQCSKK